MEERIKRMMELNLDERQWRLYLANEAMSAGYGGISQVSRISGVSRTTITKGIEELQSNKKINGKARAKGGGSKVKEIKHPEIEEQIRKIIDGSTYGNPERVLSYTTESLRKIERKLKTQGISISHETISKILATMNYSKQANGKMLQVGKPHPDRNAQFEHINNTASGYIKMGVPVISVDTKNKEKIGNFKNNGEEYRQKGDPRKVLDHDFVGVSHDTSEFAVESISRWWETVGKHTFPNTKKIYITADGGGSNGCRVRMWKYQLQQFADRTGLRIEVSHFPPGTSKWNKVEHRLFCYISQNWQGKPLVDVQTAINLIGATTTTTGLEVICVRDDTEYQLAKKVSDDEFETIAIHNIPPFKSWNYEILPSQLVQLIF